MIPPGYYNGSIPPPNVTFRQYREFCRRYDAEHPRHFCITCIHLRENKENLMHWNDHLDRPPRGPLYWCYLKGPESDIHPVICSYCEDYVESKVHNRE